MGADRPGWCGRDRPADRKAGTWRSPAGGCAWSGTRERSSRRSRADTRWRSASRSPTGYSQCLAAMFPPARCADPGAGPGHSGPSIKPDSLWRDPASAWKGNGPGEIRPSRCFVVIVGVAAAAPLGRENVAAIGRYRWRQAGHAAGPSAAADGRDGQFVGGDGDAAEQVQQSQWRWERLRQRAMSASVPPPLQPMCDVTSLRRRGLDLTFAIAVRRDTHANVKSTTRAT